LFILLKNLGILEMNWTRVRKIPPKSRGNRGFFPSNKVSGGIVEYESQLERDLFLQLEHAPEVIRFQHQPITITYQNKKGRNCEYTPDVSIEFNNGLHTVTEVKYEETLKMEYEKLQVKWNAADDWAVQNGYLFAILTEKEIRTPRQSNIWFTLGSSKCSDNNRYMNELISLLPPDGVEYNSLCYNLAEILGIEVGKSSQILSYAIYHGLVFLDTFSTKELSKDTIIRKRMHSSQSPFKPLWDEFHFILPKEMNESIEPIHEDNKPLKSLSSSVPKKYQKEVNTRLTLVKAWLRQPSRKRTLQWRKEFCKKWGISERTIYRWTKAYEKYGIDGLIPNFSNRGRSTKFDSIVHNLLINAQKEYLKPNITIKKAHENLVKSCKKNNVLAPSYTSFYRFIYDNTTASELAHKRGPKYRKSHFTPSLASFQGAIAPMQILQFDNTSFDVFPVDSEHRLSLATPYLTAAIDCYTKMITGFYLSLNASSSLSALEVLVQSILPKDNYTKAYHTQQKWPIQGFPIMILVDNGMDYRSKALKEFCLKYDIILEYTPLRTPRYKAFIEQWFNVLRKALVDEDVPATRPLLKARLENPDLKPEAEAVCTMQVLETWLHQWIIDDYHFTNSYNNHVAAPFLEWKVAQARHTNPILPAPREPPQNPKEVDLLHLCTLEREERTLRSDGIVWEHLKYNNKELSEVFATIGKGVKVNVLLDRRDIRYVWVVNPINDQPIRVGLASGWARAILEVYGDVPINASAWKRDVKIVKSNLKKRIDPYKFKKEYSKLQRAKLLKGAKKESKRIRREKEKARETNRKNQNRKISQIKTNVLSDNSGKDFPPNIYTEYTPKGSVSIVPEEEDLYETYTPKGLPIVQYPRKKIKKGGLQND